VLACPKYANRRRGSIKSKYIEIILKVIRAVQRYNESAQVEADILKKVMAKGGSYYGIV